MGAVDDTFSLLIGEWKLERMLDDHLSGVSGRFQGSAVVQAAEPERGSGQAAADVAEYRERGRIEFGAHSGPSHRALQFRRRNDGSVAVRFADGLPFFELDLSTGSCDALHPCRADSYQLSFELKSRDLLVERWSVRGPAKNYDAVTVWRRMRE
jgi:Family of unknown function (DUF6314)